MTLAQVYQNRFTSPPNRDCSRYWVHPHILVGGNINDQSDFEHLTELLGVTAVVNVDHNSDIPVIQNWFNFRLYEYPVHDDGTGFHWDAVRGVVGFAYQWVKKGPIYVHCHIGYSRSPAFAYGILRWCFNETIEKSLEALNTAGAEFGTDYASIPKHRTYLASIERALRLGQ